MHHHREITAAVLSMLAIAATSIALLPHHAPVLAQGKAPQVFTGIVKGVALGGYDPVAYFTKGQAARGSPEFTLQHQGVTWRFETAANRDAFRAAPDKYAPQYGGHCAWAVAEGYTAKGDPTAWSIVDDKLYLNYDKSIQQRWEKASRPNIAKADVNWPTMSVKQR